MYYVYELIDPRINLPFYVGKGKNNRVYFHLSEKSRAKSENKRKYNKIQKIREDGYEPEIKIVKYFGYENAAYEYEEHLIKKYGRIRYDENGILTNICESSRPPKLKGRTYQEIYGDEWEEQIQKRLKTKKERGNMGFTGKKHKEESKKKTSLKVSGKNNPNYGKKHSKETLEKMSSSLKEQFKNGRKNNTSVTYLLTSPSGENFEVFGGLKKFCKSQNISYATMSSAIKYNRKGPRRNGWSIEEKV
ncbi:MAG: hypothetical protein EBT27_10190 [Betaproteobacteria bacterium]|nr:hypothetical protein [Betaproteobacteria bacterium]